MTDEQQTELTRLRSRTARALEAYRQAFLACVEDDKPCTGLCNETEAEWRFRQRIEWIHEKVYAKEAA